MASRPPPPKLAPKPGHVKVVKALYPYSAQQPDELSFEEGETLYIVDMITDPNWWKARSGNKTGLIPSNYVESSTEEIMHPLHEAARRGNMAFLEECLANKVPVNQLDKAGCTAVHWAAHAGHEDCLLRLLRVPGIAVNSQNKIGDTPLHMASWKGHVSIVQILLQHGAQNGIKNKEGKTAFDMAKDPAIASMLKISSVDQNIDEYGGESSESD